MSVYHHIPKIEGYTRKQVVSFFRVKLTISKQWAIKGMCKLYELQTYNEQRDHVSTEENGVGFNKLHSLRMTAIARYYFVHKTISKTDLTYVMKYTKMYAAQLASMADPVKLKVLMDEYFGGEPPLRTRIVKTKQPLWYQPSLLPPHQEYSYTIV